MNDKVDAELDAVGLECPLPLLKMKQQLNRMESGQTLHVITTDVGSVRDFKTFADQVGHRLRHEEQLPRYLFWITKA